MAQLWCCRCRSPHIGCVFVTVTSVNTNILSFFPSGSALCVTLHGASSLSSYDALLLLRHFCNLRRQFCVCGLGISVSFLSSLAALAVSSPFGTLALNSCPFCRRVVFSFVEGYFLLAIFDGDDSISNSILCGFLTAADTSCSLDFWVRVLGLCAFFVDS